MIFGSGSAAWHGDLTVKKMIIGKVILEISRKNDVHNNEEQIISGCSIDGAISVRLDGGFGSYW